MNTTTLKNMQPQGIINNRRQEKDNHANMPDGQQRTVPHVLLGRSRQGLATITWAPTLTVIMTREQRPGCQVASIGCWARQDKAQAEHQVVACLAGHVVERPVPVRKGIDCLVACILVESNCLIGFARRSSPQGSRPETVFVKEKHTQLTCFCRQIEPRVGM